VESGSASASRVAAKGVSSPGFQPTDSFLFKLGITTGLKTRRTIADYPLLTDEMEGVCNDWQA
jgi:hypothetical protein